MKKQISFKNVPFFRLLVPFLFGICMVYYIRHGIFNYFSYNLITIPIVVALVTVPLIYRTSKLITGLCIGLSSFLTGTMVTSLAVQHNKLPEEKAVYTGIIITRPEIKETVSLVECRLTVFKTDSIEGKLSEKILVTYRNDSLLGIPEIGDSVNFTAAIHKIPFTANPEEFNYSQYQETRGIIYTVFLTYPEINFGRNSNRYILKRLAGKAQAGIEESFRKYSMKGSELAVLTALFAGDRSMIDNDTMNSYIASGAVHILSVSGMHVGILFMFLTLLLGKRKNNVVYVFFRLVLIILIIWLYAFITGLSASVIRASVMFSLFSIGKSFSRQIDSYNILSSSAMLILIFDPLVLFQVGFQLSYLAVLGIVYFQPRIANLFIFESRFTDMVWQLTTVGIAAQIATFPFTLFYFHQFPNYFLLTNLIAVPLVWLIMMGTILFFIVLPISSIAVFISASINFLVLAMNFMISKISSLPGSVISNIGFGQFDLFFTCLMIIIGITIYYYGYKRYLSFFLASGLFIFTSIRVITYIRDSNKNEIIIYNLTKGKVLSIIEGHKHLLVADSSIISSYKYTHRRLQNFWIKRQINREITIINIDTLKNGCELYFPTVILFKTNVGLSIQTSERIFIIPFHRNHFDNFYKAEEDIYKNYQLLSLSDKKLREDENTIILTGDIPSSSKFRWVEYAENHKIKCHNIANDGVFYLNMANE